MKERSEGGDIISAMEVYGKLNRDVFGIGYGRGLDIRGVAVRYRATGRTHGI